MSPSIATNKRRVRLLSATYFSVEPDPTDPLGEKLVSVVRTASHGEEIELTPREEKRLDDLDALYEPGVSDDTAEADRARLDAYRAERGDRDAHARAVARAVNPVDYAAPDPQPQQNVSPPGGGGEPVGDYTKGDRGAPDIQPRVLPPAGGIVRADAPDVAAASPADIAAWIKTERPNAGDTVALAEGDPVLAGKVLEAEHLATGGDPRASVAKPLTAITAVPPATDPAAPPAA